jgi:tetratricopeptide (TPR) repeat protein
LRSFVQGALDEAARAGLEQHLRACPTCREAVTSLGGGQTQVRSPSSPSAPLAHGSAIARYRLLERLGEGGMGVVYSAYDPQLGRNVALKLIRPLGSEGAADELLARFQREGRAIAQLSHPNVIAVHDMGASDGRVFIAMELADGGTLRQWLAMQPRSWREVVALYVAAGDGLCAAHRAGLVHRDFKPENVLLGREGRPRVTDFGLARQVVQQASAASSRLTSSPTQVKSERRITAPGTVMGTLCYMAPEQLLGQDVDARADQFSFCVALWEALHGALPFAPSGAANEWRLLEPKDPATPKWLRRVLERGLQADPRERYPSMEGLLAALRDDPARRLRRRVLLGAGALLLALAGVGAWSLAGRSARLCADASAEAEREWSPARQRALEQAFSQSGRADAPAAFALTRGGLDAWFASWAGMRREACEATRVRGVQSDAMLGLRMACLDRRRAEARALLELLEKPDAELVGNAAQAVRSLAPVRGCAELDVLSAKVAVPTPAERPKVDEAGAAVDRARAFFAAGKYPPGLASAQAAVTAADASGYRPERAAARLLLGRLQEHTGDLKAAEATLLGAVTLAEEAGDDELAARALGQLARLLGARLSRFVEAHAFSALAAAKAQRLGRCDELRAELARSLGLILEAEQHLPEAVEQHRKALSLWQKLEPEGLELAQSLHDLGSALRASGKPQEALVAYEAALAMREAKVGPESDLAAVSRGGLGSVLMSLGRFDEALEIYRRVEATLEKTLGPKHFRVAVALNNVGVVLHEQGQLDKALPYFERALAIREAALGRDNAKVADSATDVATTLTELGRLAEARSRLEQAQAIVEKLPPEHPTQTEYAAGLGRLLLAQGTADKAIAPLEQALKASEDKKGFKGDSSSARARFLLARALWQAGRERPRALALAGAARGFFEQLGAKRFGRDLAEIDAWLASHPAPRDAATAPGARSSK